MNKKGQMFFFFMLGLLFIFLGLSLMFPMREVVNEQMDSTLLNCSNSSISQQDKAVCTSLDIIPFVLGGVIIGAGAILIRGGLI